MNLPLLIRTVCHLTLAQIFWRARYVLERRFGMHRVPKLPAAVAVWKPAAVKSLRDLAQRWALADAALAKHADEFRAGRFTYLNQTADFSQGTDWVSISKPRLWRYQLHYFDHAKALALAAEPGDAARAHTWMHDWLAKNSPGTDVAWDAFTISARLLNWGFAITVLGLDDDDALRASYLRQARYLATHLERDVGANHLLKNACALCVAGTLANQALLEQGLALLRAQLDEQILQDGGHFEHSPMYHALVLEDLLLVSAVLGPQGAWLSPHIQRMADFLAKLLHPDGGLPFFSDTVHGEGAPPSALLTLAGQQRSAQACTWLPESGFCVLGDASQDTHLVVKLGPPGPSHQLGHAHADWFSYELSVAGERVIVNAGVHGYADSPHRGWCRSEAAHSTVQIASAPQLEAWEAFRVGRRYRCADRTVKLGAPESATLSETIVIGGVRLRRTLQRSVDGFSVRNEWLGGHTTEILDRIRLAPGYRWRREGASWRAEKNDRCVLRVLTASAASVEASHYFPEFGRTEACSCLVLRGDPAAPPAYEITLRRDLQS